MYNDKMKNRKETEPMKTVDAGEFFSAKQENHFSEYRCFPAEEYYASETAKSPAEVVTIPESFHEQSTAAKKPEDASGLDTGELRRQYEQLSHPHTSAPAHTASSAAGSAAASGASASASVSAVAVAVIVFVVASVGLFAGLGAFFGLDTGMDFVTITVNMDEVLASEDAFFGLSADDFTIEVQTENGTEIIQPLSGTHTYLVTGLAPNKSYTYSLICSHPSFASDPVCYTDTVSTLASGEPTGVYDEINSRLLYDDDTQMASLTYAVYLSDYRHTCGRATLYLCTAEQSDFLHIGDIVYTDDTPGEDGFFRGTAYELPEGTLYLYLVGETAEGDETKATVLCSRQMQIEYPADWVHLFLTVDEGAETLLCSPGEISVRGLLTVQDPTVTLGASIRQYDRDGNLLDNIDGDLALPEDGVSSADGTTGTSMNYAICCGAYYGVATYDYVIYTVGEDLERVPVYESPRKTFTADQSFTATYTKVSPADATLTYYEDHITVSISPGFTTEYEGIYYYRWEITNSAGEVYGSYDGYTDEAASIDLYGCTGLDALLFVYTDCASFQDREIAYATYEEVGAAIGIPTVTLSETSGFDGQYFTLSYTCDMVYDYANASLDLSIEMDTGDGITTIVKHIDSVAASGVVILDNLTGEPGNVSVTATLSFRDNQSDGATHTLDCGTAFYDLRYRFSVTGVYADISQGASTIPVTMKFDCQIPSSYSISIMDKENEIYITVPPTNEYYFDEVPMDTVSTLTVQVVDKEGNPFGEASTYTVSQSDAFTNYTVPYMFCVNPGDAVVTYNDDGTINIYRKIDFSSSDSRIYYNAFIYNSSETDADGRTIYTGAYDCIGRDTYAVLENLPLQDYFFHYYIMFAYEGVDYIMNMDWPSGGVTVSENPGTATVSQSGGSTTVQITVHDYGKIDNKILCDGTEYTYTGADDTEPTLVIDGEEAISDVVIFFTAYDANYDAYSTEIVLKGSRYRATTLTIEFA